VEFISLTYILIIAHFLWLVKRVLKIFFIFFSSLGDVFQLSALPLDCIYYTTDCGVCQEEFHFFLKFFYGAWLVDYVTLKEVLRLFASYSLHVLLTFIIIADFWEIARWQNAQTLSSKKFLNCANRQTPGA